MFRIFELRSASHRIGITYPAPPPESEGLYQTKPSGGTHYKSFLREEERYLLEMVRYIHLNTIRAGNINEVYNRFKKGEVGFTIDEQIEYLKQRHRIDTMYIT